MKRGSQLVCLISCLSAVILLAISCLCAYLSTFLILEQKLHFKRDDDYGRGGREGCPCQVAGGRQAGEADGGGEEARRGDASPSHRGYQDGRTEGGDGEGGGGESGEGESGEGGEGGGCCLEEHFSFGCAFQESFSPWISRPASKFYNQQLQSIPLINYNRFVTCHSNKSLGFFADAHGYCCVARFSSEKEDESTELLAATQGLYGQRIAKDATYSRFVSDQGSDL